MEKSLTLAVNKGKREARKEKVVDGEIGKAGAFLVFGTWNKTNERRERKGEVSNFPFMLGLISIPNAPRLEDRGSGETHFRAKAFSRSPRFAGFAWDDEKSDTFLILLTRLSRT